VPVFNPIDVVRWNMDKKYLAELQAEGFDIIPTILILMAKMTALPMLFRMDGRK